MDLIKLQNKANLAAKKAGEYILKNSKQNKKVYSSNNKDIKLELDRASELLIRDELKHTNIPILGEEYGGEEAMNSLKWVVDPIDGTSNLFRDIDLCCVSIALMQGHDPLLGAIYDFNRDHLFFASKNNGAYLNTEKIHVSNVNTKAEATIATGFPSGEPFESSIEYIKTLKDWKKIRMLGSAALSCAYVASGKLDCYSEKGIYLWDIAAGMCIVAEAGGNIQKNRIDNTLQFDVTITNGSI